MRQALRSNPSRRQVSNSASLAAPVKGWDAQSPLAAMKPGNAVVLDNFTPQPGYVGIRRGHREQSVGTPGPSETGIVWRGGGPGQDLLFQASDGDIYDANVLGGVPGVPVYTGLTNSRIQYINFSNDGGNWVLCFNGDDTPFKFDGTSWTTSTISGSSGSITLDPTTLIDVMVHKRRVFLMEKDTLRVWFFPVNAIMGAAQLLDLGPIFAEGGSLNCFGSWSLDGGQGPDDVAVFITNQGQAAVYQGTDPSSATDWALVGVFSIGLPLGRRSLLKYGGDLAFLTTAGVLLASQALSLDRAQENRVALTSKIQNAFSQATTTYGALFGWEGTLYPRGSLAIYNVPTDETLSTSVQFVQNLQTGAWCRWTGQNAIWWEVCNDNLYFGGALGCYQADIGVTDNGADLTADLVTSYDYYGQPGRQKQFTMVRPILQATSNVIPAVEMLMDFTMRTPVATPTVIADRSTLLETRYAWAGGTGVGYAAAIAMRVTMQLEGDLNAFLVDDDGGDFIVDQTGGDRIITDSNEPVNAQINVVGFDVVYQTGGIL
jgi:hypothetical protein